ncbi:alpha/beta hydrolase [Enterococcus sp. LJL99]
MKKLFKVMGGTLLGLLVIIILVFAGIYINNRIKLNQEAKKIVPYSEKIDVEKQKMSVQITGSGDETIALLPGYLTGSPVLDFSPLTNELAKNYRVVVVDPFGYGQSDDTDKERSVENLTKELHSTLSELDIHDYHLMGHSISGVYSLDYINTYPDEVKSFIGIDSSLPAQGGADDNQEGGIELLGKSGLYRLLVGLDPTMLNPPTLTDEQLEQFKYISLKNIGSKATVNEGKEMAENFKKTEPLSYPNELPVLYFLASESVDPDESWLSIHENMIKDSKKAEIKIYEGSHYLHHTKSNEIAREVKNFLE